MKRANNWIGRRRAIYGKRNLRNSYFKQSFKKKHLSRMAGIWNGSKKTGSRKVAPWEGLLPSNLRRPTCHVYRVGWQEAGLASWAE